MIITGLLGLCLLACSNTPETNNEGGPEKENKLAAALSVDTPEFNPDTFRYDLKYVMGQFDPATHPDFVAVDTKYADRAGRHLHKETYAAFLRMYEAAKADGITLTIISAARNFDMQKGIWEAKWNGSRKIENGKNAAETYPDPKTRALKILEYSSMPGSSRHHWGTDVDLVNLNNEYFASGDGKKVYEWLLANAAEFGFCQPYTAGRSAGYNEERWHWSYLPLAQSLTALARLQLKDNMIQGFAGSETAQRIGIVENYVLGINLECLPR
ncbi:MAG: M15 family metallopeptidase [Lewinella sp.]|nr:M15 family metallopeptidase [Lewinella sp.]